MYISFLLLLYILYVSASVAITQNQFLKIVNFTMVTGTVTHTSKYTHMESVPKLDFTKW